jgi:adenosine deaminase CECR1
MVGSTTMTLHGWKQLALWSLEYSCLSPEEIENAKDIYMRNWENFCVWINETFGAYADGLDIDV